MYLLWTGAHRNTGGCKMKEKANYPIKVLEKSIDVLDVIFKSNSPMSISQISEKLRLSPSTIHRILDTLKFRGYIEQKGQDKKYQLGLKLLELGMAKFYQIDLLSEAAPFLKELATRCNETVHLGVLEQKEVVYLAKEESNQNIRMVSRIGKRAALHSTALGKVLLAYLSEAKRRRILNTTNLTAFARNTIINKKELDEKLSLIKNKGYAWDIEENEQDVCCIAAPVKNHRGEVIAAISISSPSYRIDKTKEELFKRNIINIASQISKRLGYVVNG